MGWWKPSAKKQAKEHFNKLALRLEGTLTGAAPDAKDDVIIAGVHSSWLKAFVKKFGTTAAKASYDTIVASNIGDEDKSKKKLGNGQMIDMEIQLGAADEQRQTPIKIVSMFGYDIQTKATAE